MCLGWLRGELSLGPLRLLEKRPAWSHELHDPPFSYFSGRAMELRFTNTITSPENWLICGRVAVREWQC